MLHAILFEYASKKEFIIRHKAHGAFIKYRENVIMYQRLRNFGVSELFLLYVVHAITQHAGEGSG